jgi:hypothetical protein
MAAATSANAAYYGMVVGHEYTVLATFIVVDAENISHNLVRIRNPWGCGEYNGLW